MYENDDGMEGKVQVTEALMRQYVMPALLEIARVIVFVGAAVVLVVGAMGVR